MKTLHLELGERSYPIYIGSDLLQDGALLTPHIAGSKVAVITNTVVAPLYLEKVSAALARFNPVPVILPDGEGHKTLTVVERIFTALLEAQCDRKTTLIGLGGGVIGDMAGFAAACYQRGVPFIQIPTTLLAQVDSSVGGKTGVNHPLGKNMIGAFYQPRCVLIDTATLATLPDNEFAAGLAEVIKYGLIYDATFFSWLENNIDALLARVPAAMAYVIEHSCLTKAKVVAADEKEAGARALLNLGHTFGHAIETGSGYGSWLHGEAVAVGMVMAADLSRRLGWLSTTEVTRIETLIKRARLPIRGPQLPVDRYLKLMALDKKVQDGQLRLVLLTGIGQALITSDFPVKALNETLSHCQVAQ